MLQCVSPIFSTFVGHRAGRSCAQFAVKRASGCWSISNGMQTIFIAEENLMKKVREVLNVLGDLSKYMPSLALLVLEFIALHRSITEENNVQIWTNALLIVVTLAMFGNLYAQSAIYTQMTGERHSIPRDIVRMNSEDLSVTYNWLFAAPLLVGVPTLLLFLYVKTERKIFLYGGTAYAVAHFIGFGIKFLAFYIRSRQTSGRSSRLLEPIAKPTLINLLLILSTNEWSVGFVYRNTQFPESAFTLIVSLILLLSYLLVVLFCYFRFLYVMAAFFFLRRDIGRMEAKLQAAQQREQERVEVLRERTRLADKRAPQVGLTGKCALAVQLIGCHIRSFYQEYSDSLRYLLQLGAFHATRRGQHLLDTERIRWNTLRFCESAAVLELLILDIVLFLYLGSDDTCSRFFELLSTVIIIPILLSSLDRLKENKPR